MLNERLTVKMENKRENMLASMLTREDFEMKLEQLSKAAPSAKPSIRAELMRMFACLNIRCESMREDEYFEELAKTSVLPSFDDIETKILETLFANFDDYPTPEQAMRRIVDRVCDKSDNWQDDTLRLRILKQFIKYGNYLTYMVDTIDENGEIIKKKNGKPKQSKICIYNGQKYIIQYAEGKKGAATTSVEDVINNIDDDIFSILEKATKAQKQPEGKYGLLRLCDDLAYGRFKAGGSIKRDLYLFAIVYNMSYYCDNGNTEQILDYYTDIQKNLFEDYYSNNLMRYLTSAYSGNVTGYEVHPSGQGINYKNFAEMVYIYYLSSDIDRTEKIKKAEEMIKRLSISAQEYVPSVSNDMATKYFTTKITQEVLELSEEDFEEFIRENYDCSLETENYVDSKGNKKERAKSSMQTQSSSYTAFKLYNKLIDDMEKFNIPVKRENCNYGLWFTDLSSLKKGMDGEFFKKTRIEDPEKLDRFIKLLFAINSYLGNLFIEQENNQTVKEEHYEVSSRIVPTMNIRNPQLMTRTALVTAYYYYYNAKLENSDQYRSLMDVYNDYTNSINGLNAYLERAHYQPINDKNIFDIAVIFSSYASNHM